MEELILNILASDIETTKYIDNDDCAITRALARAGRSDLIDCGTDICYKRDRFFEEERVFIAWGNPTYEELADKVCNMYKKELKPEDFTHTLIY